MSEELKTSSFNELMEIGLNYFKEKNYKEAIKAYKLAKLMYEKNIEQASLAALYIRLGNAYYSLEDKDKATYYYEEYLKLFPSGQTSVFSRLAHAYYYIDQDKSIDYHNKSLDMEVSKKHIFNNPCYLSNKTENS